MNAEEFLFSKGITADTFNDFESFKLFINLMEQYAATKQLETVDKLRTMAKDIFKTETFKENIKL